MKIHNLNCTIYSSIISKSINNNLYIQYYTYSLDRSHYSHGIINGIPSPSPLWTLVKFLIESSFTLSLLFHPSRSNREATIMLIELWSNLQYNNYCNDNCRDHNAQLDFSVCLTITLHKNKRNEEAWLITTKCVENVDSDLLDLLTY